jgi:hypothetical protein
MDLLSLKLLTIPRRVILSFPACMHAYVDMVLKSRSKGNCN